MKRVSKLIIIIICMVLAVMAGRYFCENGRNSGETEAGERRYSLTELETANLTLTENGITIAEDPQIILPNVNAYVKEIFLEGLDTEEELQIYYSEEGEAFSEEKSLRAVPELDADGARITLGRNVAGLRIDFNGTSGSSYTLDALVINPAAQTVWGARQIMISLVLGALAGFCIVVFVEERRNIRIYLGALKKYRYLLEDMVVRDIKLKYRRSVIGFFWSILNPLLMMCVITAVFQNLFRFNVDNFAVYYLTGWCVFNFVTEATTGAMTSVLNASSLIRKVYIPKYIFPMQKCVFSFVNMLFSLVALLIVMLVLRVEITWRLLLLPVPLLLALFFSIGIGMILATAAVFFRDVIHLYGVFTMVWMYLTPIIYPMEILSDTMLGIVKLNPMYYYVDYFRQLTLYHTVPPVSELAVMAAWALGSIIAGTVIFKKKQDRFVLFI